MNLELNVDDLLQTVFDNTKDEELADLLAFLESWVKNVEDELEYLQGDAGC
jgi:hypothetical protein